MESPRLDISAPDSPPHQVALNDPALTIGRHRSNRLVIPDDRASRFHCVVEQTAEGFRLRDLHSKNGTKLNGERISSAYLKIGDSFRIGKTIFAFSVPEGYKLPPPPHPPKPDPAVLKKVPGSRSGLRSGSRAGSTVQQGKGRAINVSDNGSDVLALPIDLPTPAPNLPGPVTPIPPNNPTPPRSSPAAAGLSFAQPFSQDNHAAPTPAYPAPRSHAQPPAPSSSPPPAGYYASTPAKPAPPPAPPEPVTPAPASAEAAPKTAVPVLSPAIFATIIENLRAFANFENDTNPDAMLGESHLVPINVANPHLQAMAQIHPSDPAAQPARLFKNIALAALRARASHILIEPRAAVVVVRVRVDGSLIEVTQVPKVLAEPLIAALRALSDTPVPPGPTASQEGRFRLVLPDRPIDCRLTITPSLQGVTLTLRLADPAVIPQTLPDLCLPLQSTRYLSTSMRQPSGLILVSGPAGSGVTTTLYAALRQLDLRQLHVITIESQIDCPIDGVTQVPYDDTQPATLGPMIRVALKQSPSALLVGDIPDRDAAQAVMHAADQGYLVLAGIHARDPVASVARLLDLGVPPAMVAANMKLVVAQRLVRLLCPHCKTRIQPTAAQAQRLEAAGAAGAMPFVAKGCPRCFGSGYMLRRPVSSSIVMDDVSRTNIEQCSNTADLRTLLTPSVSNVAGTALLRCAADELVAQGLTSFDEADRALN